MVQVTLPFTQLFQISHASATPCWKPASNQSQSLQRFNAEHLGQNIRGMCGRCICGRNVWEPADVNSGSKLVLRNSTRPCSQLWLERMDNEHSVHGSWTRYYGQEQVVYWLSKGLSRRLTYTLAAVHLLFVQVERNMQASEWPAVPNYR